MSDKIESLLICKRFPLAPDLINIFCTSNLSDNWKLHNIEAAFSSNEVEILLIQLFSHVLHLINIFCTSKFSDKWYCYNALQWHNIESAKF